MQTLGLTAICNPNSTEVRQRWGSKLRLTGRQQEEVLRNSLKTARHVAYDGGSLRMRDCLCSLECCSVVSSKLDSFHRGLQGKREGKRESGDSTRGESRRHHGKHTWRGERQTSMKMQISLEFWLGGCQISVEDKTRLMLLIYQRTLV